MTGLLICYTFKWDPEEDRREGFRGVCLFVCFYVCIVYIVLDSLKIISFPNLTLMLKFPFCNQIHQPLLLTQKQISFSLPIGSTKKICSYKLHLWNYIFWLQYFWRCHLLLLLVCIFPQTNIWSGKAIFFRRNS